jgi:Domain of unknown function (DUF5615)
LRFKLDENVGRRGAALLRAAGHDISTVRDQGLQGASGEVLFSRCRDEQRALVTLDHDFGNVLRFPPEESYGLVVLERGGSLRIPPLAGSVLESEGACRRGYSPRGRRCRMIAGLPYCLDPRDRREPRSGNAYTAPANFIHGKIKK